MSRVVPVVHPTLARYVPKGARNPVTSVVATTTQARLTEADPDAFRWLKTLDYRTPIMEHEGRLWRTIPIYGGHAGPDELAAYLADAPGDSAVGDYYAFVGTPVMAMRPSADDRVNPPWRGLPETVLHGSRQANIGNEVSGARVQAFLDDRVRIAGDRAYVRADMLVCGNWGSKSYHRVTDASAMDSMGFLGHPADPKPMWQHLTGSFGGESPELLKARRAFNREHKGFPFDLVPPDAEIAPTVSHFARLLGAAIEERSSERGVPPGNRGNLSRLFEENTVLWFDASTGMVDPRRIEELLAIHDTYNLNGAVGWRTPLYRAAAYVREVIAPRILSAEPDADDVEALSSLPGPA